VKESFDKTGQVSTH